MNDSQAASDYNLHLTKQMRHECPPSNLQDLANIVKEARISGGIQVQSSRGIRRPTQSIMIKDLILQRNESRNANDRKMLTKTIPKQSRKELRAWKTKSTEHLLSRF